MTPSLANLRGLASTLTSEGGEEAADQDEGHTEGEGDTRRAGRTARWRRPRGSGTGPRAAPPDASVLNRAEVSMLQIGSSADRRINKGQRRGEIAKFTPDDLERVRVCIAANGGSASMSTLSQQFEGLGKRA